MKPSFVKYAKPVTLLAAGSLLVIALFTSFKNRYEYPFQNPGLPFEERVSDLVSRLTLEEKIVQMRNNAPAIPRLGIPKYNWWNECLHGVGRSGYNVTVFPQAIGMAATFDEDALQEMASITADEARAINYDARQTGREGAQYSGLTFWTPNINIFRDPRWGRGQETYGEDPFLTAQMGTAMVNGLQGNDPKYLKTSACAKHFAVHSGPEPKRHVFDVTVSPYDLWDTYLPAFEELVVNARVSSVMCAYNRYAGQPCCGSDLLMNDILRKQWHFTGYVTSDCGAIEDFFRNHKTQPDAASAAADAVLHGTDLECGGSYSALITAVANKQITEAEIDVSVKRLFMIRFRLGLFDPPGKVPFSKLPMSIVESKSHQAHAIMMARESMVLLKNEAGTLPLSKNIKTIAVVGPNANDRNAVLGNYNGFPSKIITVLDGIRAKVGKRTRLIYEQGLNYTDEDLYKEEDVTHQFTYGDTNGWQAEYFTIGKCEGVPVHTEVVSRMYLDRSGKFPAHLSANNAAIRYSSVFTPETAGKYVFQVTSEQGYRLFINDKRVIDQWYDHENLSKQYTLTAEAGKQYKFVLEYHQDGGKPSLELSTGRIVRSNKNEVAAKVKEADAIVFVGGISNAFEAEGSDKKSIDLPTIQTDYLKALKATGKPVIFVFFTGSAMSINWQAENLPAIINAWYGGQDAGTAIADVLFGDYNPAGRLPVTFYKSIDDLPSLEDYSMANRTYRYFKGRTLYPFGYGLSFTSFSYAWQNKPQPVYAATDTIAFDIKIANTGNLGGDEVVQAYLQYPGEKGLPLKELRAFKRIHIRKKDAQTIHFTIPVAGLKKWNASLQARSVPGGRYQLYVGRHAEDRALECAIEIKVPANTDNH